MANPTRGDVHVNRPLTNISIAFIQNAANFGAERMFPSVPVQKQSDRYWTYSQDDFFRDEMQERGPGTESAGAEYNVDSTPTYFAKKWALHKDIDDDTRANSDEPLNPDRDATTFLTQKGLIRKDRIFVTSYFKAGIWGRNLAGAGAADSTHFKSWDLAGSTPLEDVQREIITMAGRTGFKANRMMIDPYTWLALSNHAEIIDRVKFTQKGFISLDLLAAAFGVDEVVVPYSAVNTAVKGATGAYSFIVPKGALLVYAAPQPSLQQPSAGYIFPWTGLFGAGALGTRIKSFRMEPIASDRIEIEMAFDMKLVSSVCGMFFDATVS